MDMLMTPQAAAYICVSEKTLEKRCQRLAWLPQHIKLGRKVVYAKAELDRWLAERAAKTKVAA